MRFRLILQLLLAILCFYPSHSFSQSQYSPKDQLERFPETLRSKTEKLLPGSSVCYLWWCVTLQKEILATFSENPPPSSEISGIASSSEAFPESVSHDSNLTFAETETSATKLESIIEGCDYKDPKRRSLDIRMRPRPRPRKSGQ